MGRERRQSSRAPSRLTFVFTVRGTSEVRRALTKDVSGAGVCAVIEEQVRPGALLDVQLKLPDCEGSIAFVGEVVWNRPFYEGRRSFQDPKVKMGVAFAEINPKDRALIVHYAKTNALPEPSEPL